MTEIDLKKLINEWEYMSLIVEHISQFPQYIDDLLQIAFNENEPKNWRAAWMIDKIHEKYPELVVPLLDPITSFVLTTHDSGKKRHFLKLISLHPIPEEKLGVMLNHCIDVFGNPVEPIAVRVHAMQILYNIAFQENDFAGELIELIEHEIEFHGSGGISSRGKKLLAKLRELKS